MSNIPTAKEYANSIYQEYPVSKEIHELMINFAKLHVKAALKEASEKALTKWASTDFYDNTKIVSKDSILKSYPLTNIK